MVIKTISSFLVIGILLSFLPVFPMDGCPEGGHMDGCPDRGHTGIMKMDCGSLFHCPVIVDKIFSENSVLPLMGYFVPLKRSLAVDELPVLIFRPPKPLIQIIISAEETVRGQVWDFGKV